MPKPIEPMAAIARSDAEAGPVDDDRNHASEKQPMVDELPVLDRDVLDTLSEGVGEAYLPDLIQQSVDEMRTSLGRVVELGNGADLATMRREAHDLKSGSGGLGAVRLQRHAQALELACREDREEDARRLLTEIEPIAREAFDALQAECDVRSADAHSGASIN